MTSKWGSLTNPKAVRKSRFSIVTIEEDNEEKKGSSSSEADQIFEELKQSEYEVQQYIESQSPITPLTLKNINRL